MQRGKFTHCSVIRLTLVVLISTGLLLLVSPGLALGVDILFWSKGAARPVPVNPVGPGVSGACTAALDEKLYMFGGVTDLANLDGMVREVAIYNMQTDSWSIQPWTDPAVGQGRFHASAEVVGGKIYILGGRYYLGRGTGETGTNEVLAYDPNTGDTIVDGYLVSTHRAHSAAAVGTKIYVVGGWNDYGGAIARDDIEEYDTVTHTSRVVGHIPDDFGTGRCRARCRGL